MTIGSIREKHDTLIERVSDSSAPRLAPSRVAGQFYCEKKVDLTQEVGDIETPAKTRGSETHETAAEDSEEISFDEFWEALERGERQILVETLFIGEAAEFLVTGQPDAVLFEGEQAKLVFERKTTSRPNHLYDNQRIQAWLYGFILDSLGFDTSELQVAILTHDQSLDPEVGKDLQQFVLAGYLGFEPGMHELMDSPQAYLHLSAFSKIDFLEEFDWALGYWREERAPVPSDSPGKCRACEYNDVCSESLV